MEDNCMIEDLPQGPLHTVTHSIGPRSRLTSRTFLSTYGPLPRLHLTPSDWPTLLSLASRHPTRYAGTHHLRLTLPPNNPTFYQDALPLIPGTFPHLHTLEFITLWGPHTSPPSLHTCLTYLTALAPTLTSLTLPPLDILPTFPVLAPLTSLTHLSLQPTSSSAIHTAPDAPTHLLSTLSALPNLRSLALLMPELHPSPAPFPASLYLPALAILTSLTHLTLHFPINEPHPLPSPTHLTHLRTLSLSLITTRLFGLQGPLGHTPQIPLFLGPLTRLTALHLDCTRADHRPQQMHMMSTLRLQHLSLHLSDWSFVQNEELASCIAFISSQTHLTHLLLLVRDRAGAKADWSPLTRLSRTLQHLDLSITYPDPSMLTAVPHLTRLTSLRLSDAAAVANRRLPLEHVTRLIQWWSALSQLQELHLRRCSYAMLGNHHALFAHVPVADLPALRAVAFHGCSPETMDVEMLMPLRQSLTRLELLAEWVDQGPAGFENAGLLTRFEALEVLHVGFGKVKHEAASTEQHLRLLPLPGPLRELGVEHYGICRLGVGARAALQEAADRQGCVLRILDGGSA